MPMIARLRGRRQLLQTAIAVTAISGLARLWKSTSFASSVPRMQRAAAVIEPEQCEEVGASFKLVSGIPVARMLYCNTLGPKP